MTAKTKPEIPEKKPEEVKEQAPASAQPSDTPQAGATNSSETASSGDTKSLEPEPEPETHLYQVTSRSDVLLNGKLHTEGAELLLLDAVALPLLKNGCIQPKEGIQ